MPIAINGTGFITGAAGVGTGGTGNTAFYLNDKNVTVSYTISATQNALSVGPITIDTGVNVVISTGAAWVIV
jgi:hypothetical protein